jgi:hypothetical protein
MTLEVVCPKGIKTTYTTHQYDGKYSHGDLMLLYKQYSSFEGYKVVWK